MREIDSLLNTIICGDCLEVMKDIPDNSIDSIVTDPPYGLEFMGKEWDKFGISEGRAKRLLGADNIGTGDRFFDYRDGASKRGRYSELTISEKSAFQEFIYQWAKEALRVLKPGGYLLSFGGTRTYHRMVCAIEDAGFEIRDMIAWVYGSGFPKSLNIGKAVDKIGGRCLGIEIGNIIKKRRIGLGYSTIKIAEIGNFYGNINHGGTVSNWETGRGSITPEQFNKLIKILKLENKPIIANERKLLGKSKFGASSIYGSGIYNNRENGKEINITKGTSEWEGWGTALKPALEPICVARKPLSEKTVAENVLKWGTGGINIDGCRVGTEKVTSLPSRSTDKYAQDKWTKSNMIGEKKDNTGRFPTNLIHDGSDKVLRLFPNTKTGFGDSGSASRFFYCAKASKSERNRGCNNMFWLEGKEIPKEKWMRLKEKNEKHKNDKGYKRHNIARGNIHPTVKPVSLIQYLVKLVTQPDGIVLDPFAGSGTTGIACKRLGRPYILIEKSPEYCKIAEARLASVDPLFHQNEK